MFKLMHAHILRDAAKAAPQDERLPENSAHPEEGRRPVSKDKSVIKVFILAALCGPATIAIAEDSCSKAGMTDSLANFADCHPGRRSGILSRQSDYVIFDTVSINRIAQRQKSIATLLDEQASTRKYTVVGASLATAALLGGGIYWYCSSNEIAEQPKKSPSKKGRNVRDEVLDDMIAHRKEMETISGVVKQGFRDGIGYAIAMTATAVALGLVNKFGAVSWSAVKESIYPTTTDLCVEQEKQFKRYFDYMFKALQDLGQEQARIETSEQLELFVQWRGMLAADVQSCVATMVHSIENFSALAVAFMARSSQKFSEEETTHVQPFGDMMRKIQTSIDAVNQLSQTLEDVVNASDLTTLDQMRRCVSMQFKCAVCATRDASEHLVALVDAL